MILLIGHCLFLSFVYLHHLLLHDQPLSLYAHSLMSSKSVFTVVFEENFINLARG